MRKYSKSSGGILMPQLQLQVGGKFIVEHMRDGELIDQFEQHNIVVNEGLNSMLNVMLAGGTQLGSWYVGLFEANYTPVAGLTAATFAATATESTAYDETTRPAWTPAAAASQSITNSASKATFTINATKTIYGACLISDSAKGGTSGTLFAASKFSAAKSVSSGDQLLITYQVSLTSS